jgi:hypothetical protein
MMILRRAVLASGLACLLLPACNRHGDAVLPAAAVAAGPAGSNNLPWPEPQAAEARHKIIHRDADAIRGECQRAAGGDWDRWQRETEPYRAALKARLDTLKTFDPPPTKSYDCRYEPLAPKDDFPLVEVSPRDFLSYLVKPDAFDAFRKDRPVQAVHRWLQKRGIDLIFVPVPKMTEVYVEHFLNKYPADGIIAPVVRRTLLELLDADVEVADGFPLFRALRETDSEYLYNTADSHWAPKGMRIIARELADRIARYDFGQRARYGMPIFKATVGPHVIPGASLDGQFGQTTSQYAWPVLTPEQRERAAKAQAKSGTHLQQFDGRPVEDDPDSPVVLMGNSYVLGFREVLIKELNLRIRSQWRAAGATDLFYEYWRDPKSLESVKVLIWMTTDQHIPIFRELPEGIAAETKPKGSATGSAGTP